MSRSAIPEPVTAVTELAGAWLPDRLAAVEQRLGAVVGGHGPELATDAGQTLTAGGKRMRPLLVLLCAGPEAGEEAVRAATAVELVHMATLVHDDVLDAAPLRRGRATVVASSGRLRALCAGDFLLSRAFAELSAAGDADAVATLARASVALGRGELAQRQDAFDPTISERRYLERCRLKTAALFECACVIGRLTDGSSEELAAFGAEIGLAFQLLDDVLDVVGPTERTGKARGTDLLDGTATLPFIQAADADPALREVDLRALDADSALELCERITATGAPARVRAEARRRVEEAKQQLLDARPAGADLRLFELVADGVVQRYS